jgi:LmbE family N-acetylglucosaminyl deacetylase
VSHGGNLNVDHQVAYRAAVTALRPMPGAPVREIYAYEIASSTDWAPPGFADGFRPTCFVDISAVLERNRRALEAYAFELRDPPHARSLAAVETLARRRGASVALAAAEAFVTLRHIIRDPR